MLAVLFMLGCGLSDYEDRMLKSQTYVLNKDHEDQILGAPLAPPPKLSPEGQKSGQPVVDLYLRPPRAINSQYEPNPYSDIMWRYPTTTQGQAGLTAPFIAMYVAASTTMDRDQFWQDVQTPFMPVDLSGINKVTKTTIDGQLLEYEQDSRTVEERGSSKSFYMYVYRTDLPDGKVARVAVVFCTPENAGTAAQEAIDMCLKTLSIGRKPASGTGRHAR
jgi:hypothetical protein